MMIDSRLIYVVDAMTFSPLLLWIFPISEEIENVIWNMKNWDRRAMEHYEHVKFKVRMMTTANWNFNRIFTKYTRQVEYSAKNVLYSSNGCDSSNKKFRRDVR